ncbi:hypothetical protein MG293_006996 [Ovis ammon polii]|uniref:glucuronosyltransferase n=2 Tax=Bovidae TaxID=9895 RepID=A0AAD4UFX2_OVIAM|nr:hypothetical protein MG293_006996 [Ovis ammon polii]
MKTVKGFYVLFMLHLWFFDSGRTGKILVWPMDFSHWINLKVILDELHRGGHEITVLVPSTSSLLDHTQIPFNVEILQIPISKESFMEEFNANLYRVSFELPKVSWWERQVQLTKMLKMFLATTRSICDSVVTNKELLSRLQAAKFDICIADPLSFCGELVAELLNIPFIYSFRFSYGNVFERLCAGLPMPSSYVPGTISGLTDSMTFTQRLENWLSYTVNELMYSYFVFPEWDEYYSKVLGKSTKFCEIMGKAEMWLIRTSWDFEFPHPYLPNFEFVGGLHCKPAKPLPKDFEEFVQSSGKNGVVVFTLGSMVKNLTEEKSKMIASALAQLPQKVLWKYGGKKPENLGANTRIYEWIPQNDLLGHPQTRAFITHCGTNGVYEAIYHGVPMVGIPLFGDQYGNVARVKAKGAAVELDLQRMTSSDLLNALKAVINNPIYKENAMELSRIHHDTPVKPLKRAVFWIEFIMRHKGAKHLRPAFHDLTWQEVAMKTVKGFCILFVLQLCLLDSGRMGKVLVWPADFSHWINLQVILEELHHRGHEITVLIPSPSLLIDHTKVPYNVEILQLSVTKETSMEELSTILYEASFDMSKFSWWEMQIKLANIGRKFLLTSKRVCDSAVTNKELLSRLQAAKFDVCIADPLRFCGELVAELLNIPFIYTFRVFYGNVFERLCAGLPMPSSYVPGVTSRLTDKMTFIQRLENWLLYTVSDIIYSYYVFPEWDEYYSKVLGKPTTLCEIMGKADMWLFRSYWDFEFPQPYLPNIEFVGGLHCKPAKPLPKEFEEFVQSSGRDGVMVFTLGSMIKNLSEEKSNMIASALAQIPQKVLWRYTGKKPKTLGANARLYEWIPQNDLLGHPKTRAFITHCGTNGIYEAIYHGFPMVGIPVFGDQHDNVVRMKAKGAAVEVDLQRMTSEDLLNALKAVINNPFYKENAMKLSRIHHDQPVKPLNRAVFWVEFVMRHKGAKHLRPAFHDLTWFQHHSLDVIGFLLACAATVAFLVTKCCLFCCWKFGKPTTLCETMGKADMWLFRSYWDFEFPQPYLPNTEFVGGLHCKPAKPLPKELEEFVQSSGEDGVVVFTLGSMIKNLSEEKSNMIASALAQIPQKVLWRYTGKKPETLGANTRLYEWIPQNDLLGKPTTLCEIMGKADMWLFRSYWDFEFPQPYLPNTEFVGGLHCKPAKPLPKEFEEFVQSSGKDGVVVFTLGSMIKNLSEEKSNMIASALAQIPQKVLWRYTGKKPDTLGANTRLYEWIPQNDLLGHPKTRAFITHCGTNGIYEAIYHGVPMVGIPMFGDQHDNLARMKAKGAAVEVDLRRMTSEDLLNALKAVINNPFYKENAMKLSRIHHDQPVKPLDRAVFWVEFVMRHKGAKHLRPAFHDLTWFQQNSLDVIGFLLACVATVVFLVTKCCLFCYWKFGKPITLCEIMGKADMWLFRSYWDFEFPQPYLPNTEFVGGLHCKPAKPLPKEFEEFVQSSGKDGVVVFTLGSMIKNLSEEKSNMIASALAQIPQKVLWRYTGKKPETLGANTRLYKWIPQNDLLGHPKTRAFITHCGTNGIYEAIYHGVPMVGIPMFGDQHDNVVRMKAKGAAVEVDLQRMTSADLLHALKAVINNPSYKENAMKLSRIHHDQPVKPLDRAVFWVEFVMRHKGAKHLRPAFHDLTWYQRHSLDVIGFLLACVATVTFLVTKCCLFFCWKFGKTAKKKKRE